MPIRIKCPGCQTVDTIDDALRGKRIQCRHCQKAMNIPAIKAAAPTAAIKEAKAPLQPVQSNPTSAITKPNRENGVSRMTACLIGGGGVMLGALIGSLAVFIAFPFLGRTDGRMTPDHGLQVAQAKQPDTDKAPDPGAQPSPAKQPDKAKVPEPDTQLTQPKQPDSGKAPDVGKKVDQVKQPEPVGPSPVADFLAFMETDAKALDSTGSQVKDPKKQGVGNDIEDIDGLWVLVARESNGKVDKVDDAALFIEKKTILWTDKAGAKRNGPMANLVLDPSKDPKTIDVIFTRGGSKTQRGIYKLEGDKLVIALNSGDNPSRPEKFTTSLRAGVAPAAEVAAYTRVKSKDGDGVAMQGKPGNKTDAKDLDGLWALAALESSGKASTPDDEGMYVENKIAHWTNKTGSVRWKTNDLSRIDLDPSKTPPTIDFMTQRGNVKIQQGIYLLDGDKLIIALGSDRETRPGKFSTSLVAGAARAGEVRTYIRVKPKDADELPDMVQRKPGRQDDAKNLEGFWALDTSESRGKKVAPDDHGMYFEDKKATWTNKSGTTLHQTENVVLDTSKSPPTIDFVGRKLRTQPGIYMLDGDKLVIAVALHDQANRPARFTTSLLAGPERAGEVRSYVRVRAEHTYYTPDKGPKTAGNQADVKNIDGLWTLSAVESNGKRGAPGDSALLFENETVAWTNRSGKRPPGGQAGKLIMDPSKAPPTIDFDITQNNFVKEKRLGVYHLDGDKLVLALNAIGNPNRPLQFTTNLAAGAERAAEVLTYTRANAINAKNETPKKESAKQEPAKNEPTSKQPAKTADIQRLDGLWGLTAREVNGNAESVGDQALYIESKSVFWTNKSGTNRVHESAHIILDPLKSPKTIDYIITSGRPNSRTRLGIYTLDEDKLVIALNGIGNELRPEKLTTSLTAGAGRAEEVLTFTRIKPKDSDIAKYVADDKKPGSKDDAKNLNGLWAIEAVEENGNRVVQDDHALYFENKRLRWTNKAGTIRWHTEADIVLNTSQTPPTIDIFMTQNGTGTQLGIYTLDGDKLVLAVNGRGRESRPEKFTTSLFGGAGRASEVRTYVRVKPADVQEDKIQKKPGRKDDIKTIDGLWALEAAESGGKAVVADDHAIFFENKTALWTNKTSLDRWGGQTANVAMDPSQTPPTIDFRISRGGANGKTQKGIYILDGDKLVLALGGIYDEQRPGRFTTSLLAGTARAEEVRTYVRVKATDDNPVQHAKVKSGNKQDVKNINGLWVLEGSEANGRPGGAGDDALFFENKQVLWTNKAGKDRSGQTANLVIDPSKTPPTIAFQFTRGDHKSLTQRGIYSLEEDRLVIALNDIGNVNHPRQFTTSLIAGSARAVDVRIYVRAKAKN